MPGSNAAVSLVLPYMIEVLGARGTYALFAALGVTALSFIATQVPETKNRSLESIQTLLQSGQSGSER
jgi:hypothetical protein